MALIIVSLVLLVVDSHFSVLVPARQAIATALYPFQRVVLAPRDLYQNVNNWLNAAQVAKTESDALQEQRIELAQTATRAAQLTVENAQLRRLLDIRGTVKQKSTVVEILYEPPNAFSHTLVFDKGSSAGIKPGMPVIDEGGVVGQIVRVTNSTSEAKLVNDDSVSIPVQVLRNGLRLIVFGGNGLDRMSVRYLAADADIRPGDTLVTSGVGGLFPAGLPVATVQSVQHDTASGFSVAVCVPLAHPDHYRHFLVLEVNVSEANLDQQEAQDVAPAPSN